VATYLVTDNLEIVEVEIFFLIFSRMMTDEHFALKIFIFFNWKNN
jgi:hypothetical protein